MVWNPDSSQVVVKVMSKQVINCELYNVRGKTKICVAFSYELHNIGYSRYLSTELDFICEEWNTPSIFIGDLNTFFCSRT